MPPLPSVPHVIKIQCKGTFSSGYNWANVFHWVYGGSPPSISDCQSFAEDVYGYYNSNFVPLMAPSQTYTETIVTDLSSPTGAEGVFNSSTAGGSSGSEIPANAAFLISKLVLARYRGGHPRTYLPVGVQVDLHDQGHWNSSFVTTVTNAYGNFVAGIVGNVQGGTTLAEECAVSYYTSDYSTTPPTRVRRTTPVVYDIPIDGYTGNAEIASQRRRIGRKR